ncbi:MAG: preprotein translocase subunit YajC [Spirochaetales bacterium]|nr:preprotein translocase subunit YajC [Spirochaetales bacterium]
MYDFLSRLPFLQAPAPAGDGGSTTQMLMMLGVVAAVILVFYFLIIRPQNKKQKALQKMLSSLTKGDKVVTIGGIRGTVSSVKEQSVIVKVDDDVKLEFNKNAVAQVLERTEAEVTEEKK